MWKNNTFWNLGLIAVSYECIIIKNWKFANAWSIGKEEFSFKFCFESSVLTKYCVLWANMES